MVDRTLLAKGLADIRDAVARIREVLPLDRAEFLRNRTAREVVVLNLFVALQHCLALAAHWLSDAGQEVPASYRDLLVLLAKQSVLDEALAKRLAAGAGLRNLIAHRYGVLDWERIHASVLPASGDLLEFCAAMARRADDQP